MTPFAVTFTLTGELSSAQLAMGSSGAFQTRSPPRNWKVDSPLFPQLIGVLLEKNLAADECVANDTRPYVTSHDHFDSIVRHAVAVLPAFVLNFFDFPRLPSQ